MTITAYPLCWPEGWPRTRDADRRFGRFTRRESNGRWTQQKDLSIAQAVERIKNEIQMLDGPGSNWSRINPEQTVISSNLRVRKGDGLPASSQSEPIDSGVAVYFEMDGKHQCVPCDTYTKVAQNLAAVAASISALRALERHGSGLMERAFTGFASLPDHSIKAAPPWWAEFDVDPDDPHEVIEAQYRRCRSAAHPDKGGSPEAYQRVVDVWLQYQQAIRG